MLQLSEPWKTVILAAAVAVGGLALAWILTKLNSRLFRRIEKRRRDIHLSFLEKLINALIWVGVVLLAVSGFSGAGSIWRTLLGGTVVITAVAVFAAQDVIKDVLAGFMISVYRPFTIGDRVELEDGTVGVVETITMRHVVLIGLDTLRIVIPNSKLNAMRVTNYAYHRDVQSALFRFGVGYDSDMAKTKQIIAEAVESSPYSLPGRMDAAGGAGYGDVHFIALGDSALMLAVTVYYTKGIPSEVILDDINTRVREALIAGGIEIPYPHVTVTGLDRAD